jgi:hypothetical protein
MTFLLVTGKYTSASYKDVLIEHPALVPARLTASPSFVPFTAEHVENGDDIEEEAGSLNAKDDLLSGHEYSSDSGKSDSALVGGQH